MIEKELIFFAQSNGNEPVVKWLDSFNFKIQARLYKEIGKLRVGLGDVKNLKGDLLELRMFFKDGSGYRVYFTEADKKIVLLLNAGNKKTQNKDIQIAREYLIEYMES